MSLYLVKAGDPVLRSRAAQALIDDLLDGEDRTLVVEEFAIPTKVRGGGDEPTGPAPPPTDDGARVPVVAAILNAAQSPPFMTSKRIVVVRDYEQLNAEEAAPIASMLADALETTVFVFVGGGGRAPKSLVAALKAAEVVGPASEKTAEVLAAELERADLTLAKDAVRVAAERLGDDAGRAAGLVEVLGAAFGPGVTISAADVEPYLGELGSVPVFQLTNAIEEGKVAGALSVLDRLLNVTSARQPKPMHPLQILGLLQSRYRKLLRLDDPTIRTTKDAHAALGGKGSTFPAQKALEASTALGSDGLRKAVDSLHQADLDLKGASAMPENAVLEVLVARLAALHSRSRARTGARR
ncbi:MAG: DNA polymerase III subunit delta [Acidimicrobiia bacterium]